LEGLYLHAHPTKTTKAEAGPDVMFAPDFPRRGRKLWAEFKHNDKINTRTVR